MKVVKIEAYEVTDSKKFGGGNQVALFSDAHEAEKLAERLGGESRSYYEEFKIYDTADEYERKKRNVIIERALSKLTHEERLAFGYMGPRAIDKL